MYTGGGYGVLAPSPLQAHGAIRMKKLTGDGRTLFGEGLPNIDSHAIDLRTEIVQAL
jgi:hypothetical protein